MFRYISLLAFSALLFLSSKAQERPNVLFILADDLGINALNCYGNDVVESPNIDSLAKEGMKFTNGYANDPTCAPSRAAILSGQYAPGTGVYRVVDRYDKKNLYPYMKYLPPENNSFLSTEKMVLPKAFKAAGYTTGAFGKWHLGNKKKSKITDFFDEAIETNKHYNFTHFPSQDDVAENEYNADYCTRRGIDFMEKAVEEKTPFFLYMPYYLVHKPLDPEKEHYDYFKDKLKGSAHDHDEVIRVLSMVKSLDESVGELLNALNALGIEENTIVVFSSDNGHYKVKGENMFALPFRGNKGDVWEGGIRVPYIFKWKNKITGGSKSDSVIIHVDLYPTLLDLTGMEKPENYRFDGISIAPLLLQEKNNFSVRDGVYWYYTNYSVVDKKTGEWKTGWSNVVRSGNYKLIEDVESGKFSLYNLQKDPKELTNLSAIEPEKVKIMSEKLQRWKKEVDAPEPVLNTEYRFKKHN